MNRIDRLHRILVAALLWLPLATVAQAAGAPAEPRAEAAAEDPVAVMLGAARVLKAQQPALFDDAEGVLVTEVLPDTQGAAADLSPGDVLVGYGETPLSSMEQLIELTGKVGEDRSVVLCFLRDGQVREVSMQGGRIGVAIRNIAQTMLERMIELNQAGQQAQKQARYAEALALQEQGLELADREGHRKGQGIFHGNIGNVYDYLGRYQEALSHHEQALAIAREIGDRRGEGADLGNLGVAYRNLGRYPEALEHYTQALAIRREIGDPAGESKDLLNLGLLHAAQGHTAEALTHYQQALALQAELNEPETLWRLWDNLRQLWEADAQPGPAILAGKRAVNTIQAMRAASSGLDQSMQKSFMEGKEDVYRGLADDLIGQGRIPEAEQVLAMLKEEELYDYLRRRDSAEGIRDTRASLTPTEQAWNDRYERFGTDLVALGRDYRTLKAIGNRSVAEQARYDELKAALKDAQRALRELLAALADEFRDAGGERALAHSDAALKQLRGQQHTLRKMGHGAVIISTIMSKERLNLILTTPDIQLARQSPIGFEALSDRINAFRAVLKDPQADPLPLARELYGHLIAPLAADLEQAGAETLMISLDGPLRYIPLAALHDGEQWLIERRRIAVYNKATADKLSAKRIGAWQVAGLGVSKAHPPFQALDAVPGELEGIVKRDADADADDTDGVIAGRVHLDGDFDAERLIEVLEAQDDYPVLHLASHFSLNPGDTSASFLLLGDGKRLSLDDIDTDPDYELFGIDLLTLSACDTAVGTQAAGAEIESFGALAQLRGARGVLATLWPVADASTGQLMQTLYRLRGADASLTKAEALRRAQLSLLNGSDPEQPCSAVRGPIRLVGEGADADQPPVDSACRYAHPYYWAPFILMGNWL